MSDHTNGFTDALVSDGIVPTCPIIGDGLLHRCHVEGDRTGTLNLAYVLHLDGKPAGWWQYFKTGVSGTWSASSKREPMTAAMKRQIDEARQQRQAEQAKAHQEAALNANWIWQQTTSITEQSQHPYLLKKRVQPHGARLYKGSLVIALMDETGAIVNLQFINTDSAKRFLSGGRKKACYATTGDLTDSILICEGWATGASLYEATGHYVVVALDAGNLKTVSETMRRQHSSNKIIICADNDPVGIEKATLAAFACNGLYIAPPIEGQDFNDYINAGGKVYG